MPAPHRILYLNPVVLLGGAEVSLLELLRGLDRTRFAPHAVLPGPGLLTERLQSLQMPVAFLPLQRFQRTRHPLKLTAYGLNWASTVLRLAAFMRRHRIDLIHANGTPAHLYAGPAARIVGRPCLWHVRDLRSLGWLGRRSASGATRIVAISQAVADALIADGIPRPPIRTLWNGVDPEVFHPAVEGTTFRKEWGLPTDAFVAVLAAQWVPWKGQQVLVEAVPELLRRVPSAYLLLVGSDLFGAPPDYRGAVQARAAELGVAERVFFLDYRHDMPAVLAAADVLVCASAGEPFGRTLIEAMSMAKPVVATDAGGPREIVVEGVTGALVPVGNPAALAAALAKLALHPAHARTLGQQGRERVLHHFTIREHVRRMEGVYEEMIALSS